MTAPSPILIHKNAPPHSMDDAAHQPPTRDWLFVSQIKTPRDALRDEARAIAISYGISYQLIMSRSRVTLISVARQHLMYNLWITGEHTFSQIGRFLGRDHTTVMHGVDAHARRNGLPELLRLK